MTKFCKLATILFFLLSFFIDAYSAEFKINDIIFSLPHSGLWTQALPNNHNLYLIGNQNHDAPYPVLFVSNTSLKNVEFNFLTMSSQMDSYLEGRKNYIKEKEGVFIEFFPLLKMKTPQPSEIYLIGVDYQIGNNIYHERSVFFNCSGSVFHMKTLDFDLPEKSNSAYNLGMTLKCKN